MTDGTRENELTVFVAGRPAPQGSKRHIGRGRMVESSKHLPAWRAAVCNALAMLGPPVTGPVALELEFIMPRPIALSRKRPTPAATKRPDLDKLARAVFDAAQMAGIYADDSHVVEAIMWKRIAEPDELSGCRITIRAMGERHVAA